MLPTNYATFTPIQIDNEPPVIICPNNMTVGRSYVLWQRPIITDNADSDPELSCNLPTPYRFPYGPTLVDCTATDSAGHTASCNFTIIVEGRAKCVGCQPVTCISECRNNYGYPMDSCYTMLIIVVLTVIKYI